MQNTTRSDGSPAIILANTEDDPVSTNPLGILETAHRIDCKELELHNSENSYASPEGWTSWLGAISFKSKEIKFDKILDKSGKFIYDHKVYTDYNCIVDSNYTVPLASGGSQDGNTRVRDYLIANSGLTGMSEKLKAYRIAIAKERNNLYKTTSFPENYGWVTGFIGEESKTSSTVNNDIDIHLSAPGDIKQVKKIEVTIEKAGIGTVDSPVYGVYTDTIEAILNGNAYSVKQTISTTSESRRTLEFSEDLNASGGISNLTLRTGDSRTRFVVLGVKVYYK